MDAGGGLLKDLQEVVRLGVYGLASGLGILHDDDQLDSQVPHFSATSPAMATAVGSLGLRKRSLAQSDAESPDTKKAQPSPPSSKKKALPPRTSRQGGEKGGKGLRHFSMKVCEKVESKVRTTYNEVADELVAEMQSPDEMVEGEKFDEKNIRRRVYDALNVLMAMNIIAKEKKDITWKGLPTAGESSSEHLRAEKLRCATRIEKKKAYLQELSEQHVGMKNLHQRNTARTYSDGAAPASIALPFLLVQTKPHATVELEIAEDQQLVHFDFNSTPFEIHDEHFVLKEMGLQQSII